MKFIPDNEYKSKNCLHKTLHIMKFCLFFIAFSLTQAFGISSYSQSTTFSFHIENASIEEILNKIEKESEFRFLYTKASVPTVCMAKSLSVTNKNIFETLDNLFQNTDISYTVSNRQIVLNRQDFFNSTQQKRKIKGSVLDSKGEPIIGANIVERGTTNGTITDIDGFFELDVDPKAILKISYIGYVDMAVPVGNQNNLSIVMNEDVKAINEVIVVGYGTQKKATVTGSIAQVSGAELKQSPSANLSNALVGRMPGVIANNRSGEPGNDYSEIFIRGKGSLGNNNPLYVIDGVANRGGIERLNPSDIESITILKDASAAIYGAQAANGVILITTKRGNDSKPVITYEGNLGLSEHTRTPNLMNAYQYMVYDDEINAHFGRTEKYKDIKNGYLDGTIDPLLYADTDWMDVVFKAAPQTQHSLSVRGGNDRVKYYISGGYLYQEPGFKNTNLNFKTAQVRSNLDAKITKDFTVTLELALRQEDRHKSNYNMGTFFWEAFHAYPFLHDFYPNGLPGPGISWGNNLCILASGKTGYNKVKDNFSNTKVAFDLKMPWILDGLYTSGYVAFDSQFRSEKKLMDMWDAYRYNPSTGEYDNIRETTGDANVNLTQRYDDNRTTSAHIKLGYEKRFENHSFNAFIAYEQSKTTGDWFSAYRRDFLSNAVDYLFAGSDNQKDNDGKATISARQNFFGRLSYGFKDRYLAEFTLRRDGSQNFISDSRWGWFPGVSAGWRISEEPFFQESVRFVNELKLKASWGKLGNDRVDPFQYINTYELGTGAMFGLDPLREKGFSIGRLANPNITWEEVDTKNIGFESILLDYKLNLDFQYFYSMRTNILTQKQASVPDYTGLTLPDQNIGEISNQGVEMSLMYKDKVEDLNYYIGGNFTFARNKIHFFDEAANTPDWQRRTGHSIDSWLVYKTDGLYQTQEEIDSTPHLMNTQPGDIKYLDVDGDGEITSNDRVRIYESAIPQIVYGINMGAKWRNFELNVLWTGQGRAKQMIRPGSYNRDVTYFNNRWISAEETPNAKYPRAFERDDTFNKLDSDFWLKDASFIRLKNIEFAYNLPSTLLEKINITNLRVYVSGFNLFSIDKIKIQDPEGTNAGGMYYPQQRVYNVGVNISF
ncbi:MAG: TonB-dependent receptor [Massilibacteroides sp.]|nr:TonB-dependent receptor [Massilibacteroides sp.]